MKVFLAAVAACIIVAGIANLVLVHGFQTSAEDAFSTSSARP
jgi:hypothetical protein